MAIKFGCDNGDTTFGNVDAFTLKTDTAFEVQAWNALMRIMQIQRLSSGQRRTSGGARGMMAKERKSVGPIPGAAYCQSVIHS
jgi:hypothetical protein